MASPRRVAAIAVAIVAVGAVPASPASAGGPDPLAPAIEWTSGGHSGGVSSSATSPDGALVASVSAGDATLKIWEAATGQLVRTIGVAFTQVHDLAWSPDGAFVFTGQDWLPGFADATLKMWRVSDGTLVKTFNVGANYDVLAVAISPDGALAAIACNDFKARLFSVGSGALVKTLAGHSGQVFDVAFSPDGTMVATGSADDTAKLWSVPAGALLHTLTGHAFFVSSVAFTPDSATVVSGGWDASVRKWNASTGALLDTFPGPVGSSVYALSIAPDGATLAAAGSEPAGDNIIRVRAIAGGAVLQTMPGHLGAVFHLDHAPDGTVLSSGADDLSRRWNPADGALLGTLGVRRGSVTDVAFSDDSALFAATGGLNDDPSPTAHDGDIELWSASGEFLRRCSGHIDVINSVAFSHDGALVVSGAGSPPPDTTDHSIKIWNVADATLVRTLSGHPGGTVAVDVSVDNTLIASGGRDAKLRIWNIASGAPLASITAQVSSLAFTPDGQTLVTGGGDGKIRLWHVGTWAPAGTIDVSWPVQGIAISADGALVVAGLGSYGDNVGVWSLSDGALVRLFDGDESGFITSVDFSPDGSAVAAASGYTHEVTVWDIVSGGALVTYTHETGWGPSPLLPVDFSADGTRLGIGRGDATLVVAQSPLAPRRPGADLDGDGDVDGADLGLLLAAWGSGDGDADLDGNGVVDGGDLGVLLASWG